MAGVDVITIVLLGQYVTLLVSNLRLGHMGFMPAWYPVVCYPLASLAELTSYIALKGTLRVSMDTYALNVSRLVIFHANALVLLVFVLFLHIFFALGGLFDDFFCI